MTEEQRIKQRKYNQTYYYKHRDELLEKKRNKIYDEEYLAKLKEYRKKNYQKNKEKIDECNRQYRLNNKKKFAELCRASRKRKAIRLSEQGQIYTYLPKKEREQKMIKGLMRKFKYDETYARELLEINNWNYKSLLENNNDYS